MGLSPPLLQSASRPDGVESPSGLSPLLPATCSLASFSNYILVIGVCFKLAINLTLNSSSNTGFL